LIERNSNINRVTSKIKSKVRESEERRKRKKEGEEKPPEEVLNRSHRSRNPINYDNNNK